MTLDNGIGGMLRGFAAEVTAKSGGAVGGEAEDQLRAPFESLLKAVGAAMGKEVVCIGETRLAERQGKPDYGVTERGLLTGYAELKAPGKGVTRQRLRGPDLAQFKRFSQLPNILYCDGNEWALYSYGKPEGKVVRLNGDVSRDGAAAIGPQDAGKLLPLLTRFLEWAPIIPLNPQGGINLKEFAKQLAPLCQFLRDDVMDSLADGKSPLNGVGREWRKLLFPNAGDEQFADAYAQTVTFALLLACGQGAGGDGRDLTFSKAKESLQSRYTLMAAALDVLIDPEVEQELRAGLNALLRLVGAVPPSALGGSADPWLYFYEDFLAEYDNELRKNTGVYYTPLPVVQAQVRLADNLLTTRLGKPRGFAEPGVITIDPATGTGTYLLGIIDHCLRKLTARYGPGAAPGFAAELSRNLHGFELMVGPYAVSELRVGNALAGYGAAADDRAQVYLTDTLESPEQQPPQGNLYVQRILAQQGEKALRVKKSAKVLVCIGNPPYDRALAANAAGGWVRHGDAGVDDRPILEDFLQPARAAGQGVHLKNLYNLYVYFWRWALWKVFEQDTGSGPGIVSFISASSYLDGNAFAGMREHLRRLCDEIWILDLGGEGRGPRKSENVFNIQTPVAIAVAFRAADVTSDVPAKVRYARIAGTREEKLAALDAITDFGQVDWQECSSGWQDFFMPSRESDYFQYPLLTDLMPWQHSGVQLKRTWPIAADVDTLQERWRSLLKSDDRAKAMRATEDRQVNGSYNVELLGHSDTTPISELATDAPASPICRYAYRFLDRQYLIADGRLISRPRPPLWDSFSDKQIYLMSRLTRLLGNGPAMTASALIPDLDNVGGGGKDVMPLYRDAAATEPNITPGLLEMLGGVYGREVTPEDFAAYLYGIMAHPGYTGRYYQELDTRQVRVPLTRDGDLFGQVRDVGARLLWRHTYGQRYAPGDKGRGAVDSGAARCIIAVPSEADGYPESFRYDAGARTLYVGEGQFAPVAPEVYGFELSGLKVAPSWLGYRMKRGAGRQSSPLDEIRPAVWPAAYTAELLELLWTLEATTALYPEQARLLEAVVGGEGFTAGELPPAPRGMRQPPVRPAGGKRMV